MSNKLLRFSWLMATTAVLAAGGLMGCDKNGQSGILQQPRGKASIQAQVVPDKKYEEMLETTTSKLDDEHYLIITKAQRGSVFTIHTGPQPTQDRAVCYSSTNTPGFRTCVDTYFKKAGEVAIVNNQAGWWATPL
jgi:hypothetical protein